MLPSPGHPDVEQSTLLLDRIVALGVADRQQTLDRTAEENGIPLQALGRVQGSERDRVHGRRVASRGPLVELGDQGRQRRRGIRSRELNSIP